MKPGPIDYGELIRDGLRSVMARSLAHTVEHGLHGDQHFYITYRTGHSGVIMPDWLREQFPEEITIVLESYFEDLTVLADRFSVALNFNNEMTMLVVPFAAVHTFRDPSVGFQIDIPPEEDPSASVSNPDVTVEIHEDTAETEPPAPPPEPLGDPADRVVSLDAFRKK